MSKPNSEIDNIMIGDHDLHSEGIHTYIMSLYVCLEFE